MEPISKRKSSEETFSFINLVLHFPGTMLVSFANTSPLLAGLRNQLHTRRDSAMQLHGI